MKMYRVNYPIWVHLYFYHFLYKDRQSVDFLSYLNSQHPNVRFILEIGPTTLPFLNVLVDDSDTPVKTCVYCNPTYTSQILHFSTFSPPK